MLLLQSVPLPSTPHALPASAAAAGGHDQGIGERVGRRADVRGAPAAAAGETGRGVTRGVARGAAARAADVDVQRLTRSDGKDAARLTADGWSPAAAGHPTWSAHGADQDVIGAGRH